MSIDGNKKLVAVGWGERGEGNKSKNIVKMLLANFQEHGFLLHGLSGVCGLKAHPFANFLLGTCKSHLFSVKLITQLGIG